MVGINSRNWDQLPQQIKQDAGRVTVDMHQINAGGLDNLPQFAHQAEIIQGIEPICHFGMPCPKERSRSRQEGTCKAAKRASKGAA